MKTFETKFSQVEERVNVSVEGRERKSSEEGVRRYTASLVFIFHLNFSLTPRPFNGTLHRLVSCDFLFLRVCFWGTLALFFVS